MLRELDVLLVEDSPTDALLVEEALPSSAFNVLTCTDLRSALELLQTRRFDVVLLDLGLPDSQGLATMRGLREKCPQAEVAVLVLTGNDDEELALQALQEGAQDYLIKNELKAGPLARAIRYAVERTTVRKILQSSETERRRGVDDLRRSQHQMERAQQRGHLGHWEIDVASNRNTWSAELYRIYHLARQEAVNPLLTHSIHPADRERVELAIRTALNDGGEDFQFDYRIQPAGGPLQYLELRGESLLGANGRPATLEGTVQDITSRMLAEDALRQSQRRMESAQRVAHVGDWDWNCATDEIAWSDEYYRIFGLEPQSLAPNLATGLKLVHPEDRARIKGEIEHAVATGEDMNFHYRLLRPDGELRYLEGRGECIPHADAENGDLSFPHWAGIIHDVTDRIIEELRLRAILDNASDGIITVAESGNVVSFNLTAQQMFGYREAEMVGQSVYLLAPPEQRAYFEDTVRRMCRGELGQQRSVQGTGLRSDGSKFPFELSLNVFTLGDKPYVIGINRDITERIKLEDQLRQSQKMEAIGKLAGGVAHDFNNVLTIINLSSQMAQELVPPAGDLAEYITDILHAADRAAMITSQLLAFSRQQVLTPRKLDLNSVVEETEKMLRRLIGEDVSVVTTLAPQLSRILVDQGQIVQVIMNLAVNARDAMPQGGKLTIATSNFDVDEERAGLLPDYAVGPHVLLTVSDNGCGMPPAVQARIFEPFFTTKEIGQGTGLGLSTVYGIVKQSGGNIEVYSEPGQGTTFRIYFPAVVDENTPQHAAETVKPNAGTETVLVVEDDPALRKGAVTVLESRGYTVLAASGGREALELAGQHPGQIHLLLTDLVMPEMSGRQVAEAVTKLLPGIKVLYMSGYTDDAVVRHGLVGDSVAFLQKPFTITSLASKVREVLDKAA